MGVLKEQVQTILELPEYQSWAEFFETEMQQDYFADLDTMVTEQMQENTVYPPKEDIFAAFATPADGVKVVLLGQDPYHNPNQAMGLSFSVRNGITAPPSLRNIKKELNSDIGENTANGTDLTPWAKQGVLLLNTVLTVNHNQPNSHAGKGWETFTLHAIQYALAKSSHAVVGILWGSPAQKFEKKILSSGEKRFVVKSVHPSPLSAFRGFFGSKPFSQTNAILTENGEQPIDWTI